MKYYVKTFGCQMNFHDSEKISGILDSENCTSTRNPSEADIIIFNTCSIRQKAEQKFYSSLGRFKSLKERNPELKIIIAGCIAQQDGKKIFRRVPFVDHIIGPQNINRIRGVIHSDKSVLTGINPEIANMIIPASRESEFKASINIMYGCNNFCSYCIVPYTRGREVSRPSTDILNEIYQLADLGCREVILLGQNVNSYHADIDFTALLYKVNKITGIERVRFITSHPRDFSEKLVLAMRDFDKICEHIHLPLQSGSDRILKLMNRGYTFSDYFEKIEFLRRMIPEIALTTDIITGFPSEGSIDHENTIRALKEIEFDGIFAFNYSIRPMTAAAKMEDQIDEAVKLSRLNEILNVQDEITLKRNRKLVGEELEVMIESASSCAIVSRSRTNKIVNISSGSTLSPGTVIRAEITEAHKHSLNGSLV